MVPTLQELARELRSSEQSGIERFDCALDLRRVLRRLQAASISQGRPLTVLESVLFHLAEIAIDESLTEQSGLAERSNRSASLAEECLAILQGDGR